MESLISNNLASEAQASAPELYVRYGALVDKKFESALTLDEESELRHLETTLDAAETTFYEPASKHLQKKLATSRRTSRKGRLHGRIPAPTTAATDKR